MRASFRIDFMIIISYMHYAYMIYRIYDNFVIKNNNNENIKQVKLKIQNGTGPSGPSIATSNFRQYRSILISPRAHIISMARFVHSTVLYSNKYCKRNIGSQTEIRRQIRLAQIHAPTMPRPCPQPCQFRYLFPTSFAQKHLCFNNVGVVLCIHMYVQSSLPIYYF